METEKTEALSLMRGQRLKLTDDVSIYHPTLGEIEKLGYEKYSEMLFTLISTSLDIADILWFEHQIWYEDIKSEWEFFIEKSMSEKSANIKILSNNELVKVEPSCILIEEQYAKSLNYFLGTNGEYIILQYKTAGQESLQTILYNACYDDYGVLYIDSATSFKFTENFYNITLSFLKEVHNVKTDYEFTRGGNKSTKINLLKYNVYNQRNKKKKDDVTLDSIVSSLIAKGQDAIRIWELPIYLVYNIYYRHHKIIQYDNHALGYFTGNVGTDPKKPLDWEKLNWSNTLK